MKPMAESALGQFSANDWFHTRYCTAIVCEVGCPTRTRPTDSKAEGEAKIEAREIQMKSLSN